MTKRELAISLTKLDVFEKANIKLEQYPTDANIAAEVLWFADLNKDIEGKTITDLGAGTGILGIGCLLMGAKKVLFVEKDSKAISILKNNLELIESKEYEIINKDIQSFNKKVDLVIQNPPFGTKDKHADKLFLEKAMSISNVVYSFHKVETKEFVNKFILDKGFRTTHFFEFDFPLKHSMDHHRKKVEKIKVGCWRIEKK